MRRAKGRSWPDGTLFEMVRFGRSTGGGDEMTDAERERWIASFPLEAT